MRQKYEKELWNLKSNENTEQMKTMGIDYEKWLTINDLSDIVILTFIHKPEKER